MRIPFVGEYTLRCMSPSAAKLLIFLADTSRRGRCRGTIIDDSAMLQFSRATWRAAMEELLGAGVVVEYATHARGYRARLRPGDRFSWLPSYDDGRYRRLSPRASKVLLVLARAAYNGSSTVRMRQDTIADRLGRSIRTAQLALRELASRCMVFSYRTGRSNWYVLNRDLALRGEKPRAGRGFAHQTTLLLRLLSTTPARALPGVLAHAARRSIEAGGALRDRILESVEWDARRRQVWDRLIRLGLGEVDAFTVALRSTVEELETLAEMISGRAIADVRRFAQRALDRGWCT